MALLGVPAGCNSRYDWLFHIVQCTLHTYKSQAVKASDQGVIDAWVVHDSVVVHACRTFRKQVASGYEWQQGDIHWSERNSIVYPAISSLAGLVAGMFGVGGGIVKVSLMPRCDGVHVLTDRMPICLVNACLASDVHFRLQGTECAIIAACAAIILGQWCHNA